MTKRPDVLDAQRRAALDGIEGIDPLPPPEEKSSARRASGVAAHDLGEAFERYAKEQHSAAFKAGFARLRHVGPPHQRTGPGGTVVKLVGLGPADFQGAIRARHGEHWRPLAVEAKSRAHRLQRHDIEPHQHEDLRWVESIGGVALVLIELHDDDGSLGTWAVPWNVIETLWRRTTRTRASTGGKLAPPVKHESASVGPEELVGWEVPPGALYLERFLVED